MRSLRACSGLLTSPHQPHGETYQPKLLDGMKARIGRGQESDRARVALYPYTSIFVGEIVCGYAAGTAASEAVRLTLRDIHTHSVSLKKYIDVRLVRHWLRPRLLDGAARVF